MEKQYGVSSKLLQELLDYLASRPYYEVYKLVANIQQVKEIQQSVQEANQSVAQVSASDTPPQESTESLLAEV